MTGGPPWRRTAVPVVAALVGLQASKTTFFSGTWSAGYLGRTWPSALRHGRHVRRAHLEKLAAPVSTGRLEHPGDMAMDVPSALPVGE